MMISKGSISLLFYHTLIDMLPGLLEGQEKMSKSDMSSAIFMEDEEKDVNTKINKGYCPPKIVEGNPCLEYVKYIAFPWFNEFTVERKAEYGGTKTYKTFEELVVDYEAEALHLADVKSALAKALNKILQPVLTISQILKPKIY